MKSKIWLAAILVVSILALAGIAAAFMGRGMPNGVAGETYHDDMYNIMAEGKYSDLVSLREKVGFEIMLWVDSEEDFKFAQQMHKKMLEYREKNGISAGRAGMGMGIGIGRGMTNCPMHS